MIPIFEFDGIIPVITIVGFIVYRLYNCILMYNNKFITHLLYLSIFTSIIWLLFGYHYKVNGLIYQLIILLIIYIIFLFIRAKKID